MNIKVIAMVILPAGLSFCSLHLSQESLSAGSGHFSGKDEARKETCHESYSFYCHDRYFIYCG
jgi:hypothetical protein